MYEQHPVPQQISSYSFKLVGDMTLKQFFQIAGGAVVALIFYALSIIPAIIRWPMIIISALSGAAFAFLPIQNRPLEQWLLAFFRAVYSPTIYVWTPDGSRDDYFASPTQPQQQVQAQAQVQQQVQEPAKTQLDAQVEAEEANRLSSINNLMQTPAANSQTQVQPQNPPQQQRVEVVTKPVTQAPVQAQTQATENTIQVPQQEAVATERKGYEDKPEHQTQEIKQEAITEVFHEQETQNAQQAKFSPDAAPPTPPTQANILVGQVMTPEKKIVEGAILEIKDKQGRPVRALKTNRAGHFMIVTPLPDGEFTLTTEKDGLEFEPISITTSGEIVEPIAVQAKNQTNEAKQ